ncbi:hypothetical protein KUTG_06640 [Kutzneria sp. 744]|nr:hypothetical protein KUTG_06640 [Kutzneria sp. 744]
MVIKPSARPFDQAAAFPELLGLREAVRAADWTAIELFFAGLSDVDMTAFAVNVVGGVEGAEDFLAALPPTPLARRLHASRRIAKAWEIRSGYRAAHVSRDQFAGMHEQLRVAEPILIKLTAEDPSDAVAWCLRLNTALGLQMGQSESRRRYDRLARSAPHCFTAQGRLLQQLCPKWGGNWEVLHAFGRECMDAAPPGSLSPIVLAEAHLEHYFELEGPEAGRYLRQVSVQREIIESAEKSVLHPDFAGGYHWPTAHGVYALLFGRMGDQERAKVHFTALGEALSEYPWQSASGTPEALFRRMRDKALGGAK